MTEDDLLRAAREYLERQGWEVRPVGTRFEAVKAQRRRHIVLRLEPPTGFAPNVVASSLGLEPTIQVASPDCYPWFLRVEREIRDRAIPVLFVSVRNEVVDAWHWPPRQRPRNA